MSTTLVLHSNLVMFNYLNVTEINVGDHTFLFKNKIIEPTGKFHQDIIIFDTISNPRDSSVHLGYSSEKIVKFFSMNKLQQEYRLALALNKYKKHNAGFSPEHYFHNVNYLINNNFCPNPGETYILKPNIGANSKGQLKYTHEDGLSLSALSYVFSDLNENTITFEQAKDKITRYGFKVKDEYFKPLNNQPSKPGVRVKYHFNFETYIASTFIENITHEYRIILDHKSQPVLIMERELLMHEGGHYTPSGIDRKVSLNSIDKTILSEITEMLTHLDIPMSGIDIVITAAGKWSILEFSVGFARSELPTGFYKPWLTSCLLGIKGMDL